MGKWATIPLHIGTRVLDALAAEIEANPTLDDKRSGKAGTAACRRGSNPARWQVYRRATLSKRVFTEILADAISKVSWP
jgi:hypothetical protein